ncbi:MAG: O-antigen ligase family protein [candidate division Zixibacteria bacterium]|nr:O-antigen ligase family protein [candidate division Zixibacteria bacterium]
MVATALKAHFDNSRFMGTAIVSAILIFILGGIVFLMNGKIPLAFVYFGIPFLIVIISYPRAAIYLYIFSLFIFICLSSNPPLMLIDIAALMFLASFGVDFLLKGKTFLRVPSIVKYGLVLLTTLVFATLFAHHPEYSYGPIVRVSLQLAIVLAIYNLISGKDALIMLKTYFWLMVLHSLYNFITFVMLKGEYRIFGLPGVYFDDLAILAFPIGLAYFIWSERQGESLRYGLGTILIIFGLLATHSRGPVLTIAWVGLALVIYSRRKALMGGVNNVRSRLRMIFLAIIPVLLIFIGFSGIFRFALERLQTLENIDTGTIWMRFFLWKASLTAFLSSPFTGIGPGNFRYIESILPALKFDEAALYVHRLSAHNMFLHYLAESGIIGAAALVTLYLKNFMTAKNIAKHNPPCFPRAFSMALFGVGLTIFATIFYMDGWAWGQNAFAAPLFFAIIAKVANCGTDA